MMKNEKPKIITFWCPGNVPKLLARDFLDVIACDISIEFLNYYAKTNESEKRHAFNKPIYFHSHFFSRSVCCSLCIHYLLLIKLNHFSIALLTNCCPIFNKYLPCFVILCDYGRWCSLFLFFSFLFVLLVHILLIR